MKEKSTISFKQHPVTTDVQLVQGCLSGDIKCQRILYEQYKRAMFRICLRYATNRQEAEDFLQDGFVKVFKDLHQFRMEGPLGAWIRKVILNTIFQQLRKRKLTFRDIDTELADPHMSTEEDIPGNLDAEILTTYIQKLPDGYRTVFNMFVIEGYTHQEIADTLKITVGTSKSQLSKARAMLRVNLTAIHSPESI